jgi:hypothetical protein
MTTWEYLIVSLPRFHEARAEKGESPSVTMLNLEGARGWEAVGMTAMSDGNFAVLLKRPVGSDRTS